MPRLISFAMTWRPFLAGVGEPVELREGEGPKDVTRRSRREYDWWICDECVFLNHGLDAICASCDEEERPRPAAKTWRPGWDFLKAGDVLQPVEWSPRVGRQWVCRECGPITKTVAPLGISARCADVRGVPFIHSTCAGYAIIREPARGPLIRVASARPEIIGDITATEIEREGFPDMTPEDFVSFYSGGKPDPSRPVTRIEFERATG